MILIPSSSAAPPAGIGGKAAGLYRLQAADVRVPDFAVLPAQTFAAAETLSVADEAAALRRRDELLQFQLNSADRAALLALLHQWNFPHEPVVVRSSVADEDGQHAAFAGLMDSFLNLTTPAAVETALARCAASAYSDRALAYRHQKNLPLTARPAVIVQRQITPTASGVLFSTFPEYPQELAVHAVWGFGEGLVGGQLPPDEFYFSKQTRQVQRQVLAHKEQQLLAHPEGGLTMQPVPAAQQAAPCLTPAQLAELFAIGQRLEQEFGGPQDVEFVVAAGQVWVVQARPITQPIPEVVVYDNSNIQESYCGVTTPLTFSFAQRAYATVYRQTMHALGLPAAEIAAQEPVVTQLLGLVKGRIYYNINNWYRGLQLLPTFRQNKADMERMMGLEEPVDFVQSREKTLVAKLRLAPRLLLNLGRLLWAFRQLKKTIPAFQARFEQHYCRFYQLPLHELSAAELLAEKQTLDTELLGRWTTPIVNDFFVMMSNGRAVRLLQRIGAAQPEELLRRYLAGGPDLASAQPTYRLLALARQLRPREELRQLVLALPDDLPARLRQLAPDFAREVDAFIAQYGDRTVGELKLETQTMRTRPLIFYQYLRNYLAADAPAEAAPAANDVLSAAQAEVAALLRGKPAWRRRRVLRQLNQLQRAIHNREALRLERTRLFGMYRGLYLALGERLVAAGQLREARDVFWLTETEIAEAVTSPPGPLSSGRGGAKANNDSSRQAPPLPEERGPGGEVFVAERQQEFARYAREDVPSRVVVPSPPLNTPPAADDDGPTLRGTGCYPGQLSGEVLVITSPEDDLAVSGKIVCALRTDPGWAALFPACRGVIIEKGSSLSHSVILLRELGIPTIINVPGLTRRLRSSQHIRMDGSTGEIELLN